MKVLLCNVSNKANAEVHDYVGLFYLAAVAEQAGFTPLVYHGAPEGLLEAIQTQQPSVVGFSCDFNNQDMVTHLSRVIKAYGGITVIVGGPQSIALKEEFFQASQADYVLQGEGEIALPLLLNYLLRGEGDLHKIQGLGFIEAGHYQETAPPESVADLDALPLPAYHCSLHADFAYGKTIFTGRGCPYRCAYCASNPLQTKVRLRSIPAVVEEIRQNLSHNPSLQYIIVMDDTFTLKRERVEEFCQGMEQLRQERDFVWYCECHVGLIANWKDILPRMIQAGLFRLQIGIESGDQRVLDLYNKQLQLEDVVDFVTYAAACGLPQLATNFIVGGPDEEPGLTAQLIETLIQRAPGVIDITTGFLRAYPGTPIANEPAQFGLQLHDAQGRSSSDDYPFVTPLGFSQDQVMMARQQLNKVIRRRMQALLKNHALPEAAMAKQFQAALHYGIRSRWFEEIAAHPRAYEYYHAIYLGEGEPWTEEMDFAQDYPQRTFELWRTMTFQEGFPQLDGVALAPLEYELLLRCAGKKSLAQIEAELFPKFGGAFLDQGEFHRKLLVLLKKFDGKYWLTHFTI